MQGINIECGCKEAVETFFTKIFLKALITIFKANCTLSFKVLRQIRSIYDFKML